MIIERNEKSIYPIVNINAAGNYDVSFIANGIFALQFVVVMEETGLYKPVSQIYRGLNSRYKVSLEIPTPGMLSIRTLDPEAFNQQNLWTQLYSLEVTKAGEVLAV